MLGIGYSKPFWQKYFTWVHKDEEFSTISSDLSFYYEQIWSDETRHLSPNKSREAIVEFWLDWKQALIFKFPDIYFYFTDSGTIPIIENYFEALSSEKELSFQFIKDLDEKFPLEKNIILIREVVESLAIILDQNLDQEWYRVETIFYFSKPIRETIIDIVKNIDLALHIKLISISDSNKAKDGRSHFRL